MLEKNTLVRPEAFEVPDFERLYADYKQRLVALIAESDPNQAEAVQETLASDTELLTKFLRHNVLLYQQALRDANERYRQTLPDFAQDTNLDAIVKRLNLTRRANENNTQLRERYYLSLTAPARGTKLGYIYQSRTLDEAPLVTLKQTENGFCIDYTLQPGSVASLIKTTNATNPRPGVVDVIYLAFESEDNPAIQAALEQHLAREKLLTDQVNVLPAERLDYTLIVTLGFFDDPDSQTILVSAEQSIRAYLEERETIGATIEPTEIIHRGREAGAKRVTVTPSEPIEASPYQVPVNTNLIIEAQLL